MRNIYILWASIRPDFVQKTSQVWINNCTNKENLFFKIAMASEEQKILVESYQIPNCEVSCITERGGYNYAITQLTLNLEVNDDDILVLLSDDFSCLPAWDKYLLKKFDSWEWALFLDDGCQDVHRKSGKLCITLACMTYKCLKRLNKVVFTPNYYHFFSDDEAFHNLYDLGLLKDDRDKDHFIFHHQHHSSGYRARDQHDFTAVEHWDQDNAMWNKRSQMNVQDRLRTILG
jgi:hypothetical protein